MTTTPLPPPDTHCFDDDTQTDVWSYSAPLVEQIVKQARADLEAEVQRLREALTVAYPIIQSEWFVQRASYGKNHSPSKAERADKAYELTRAALEGKP